MAQEGLEASVASSFVMPNWWEIHTNPISYLNTMNRWQPHSNSSCEDPDMSNISTTSFTNASNHSALSVDSSSADLSGEPAENQLWREALFSVGSGGGDLHNSHNNSENFLEMLSSKTLSTEMFNPACDYLKKLDSSYEQFTNHSPVNSSEINHLDNYNGTLIEPQRRLTNLSDMVTTWPIAPPNNLSLNPDNLCQIFKNKILNSPSYPGNESVGYFPSFVHDIKGESQHHNHVGYQVGLNNSMIGINNKYCNGISSNNVRNLSDSISFRNCLNKPAMEFRTFKPSVKGSDKLSCVITKKQGYETSSYTKGSGKGSGTGDGKKKRSEDNSETLLKKSKHDSSNASSVKIQPPKIKLGDKIATLQQIVSPFGKTDTASVLQEAINCIRFLQEQLQLLSDPYMKSSTNKEHNSWGGLERKEKVEAKLNLRSRGLCLVPISCTPQLYRENTEPDNYWTPTYRGCLRR